MKKGPLRTLTGSVTYDGVLDVLDREREHERRIQREFVQDENVVALLSLLVSSLSKRTAKDLVPVLGQRVFNQTRATADAQALVARSSPQDRVLLEMAFLLLDECPGIATIFPLDIDQFPPLLVRLLQTVIKALAAK